MAAETASMDGLLIPSRCLYTSLEVVGAVATDSTYTEATPRPGTPVYTDAKGRWEMEVSGAQSASFGCVVRKTGQPSRNGIQLAYRLTSEASAAYRSWEAPGLITGFLSPGPNSYNSQDASASAVCLIPSTGKVITAYYDMAQVAVVTSAISPDESIVNTNTGLAMDASWADGIGLVCLPDERLLLYLGRTAYYSDDAGVTWTIYAQGVVTETLTNYRRVHLVQYRGDVLMLVISSTANTVYHLTSTDGGASFGLVDTYTGLAATMDLEANDDGVHVVYWTSGGTVVSYRRMGTIFDDLDLITAVSISTGATDGWITADGGGTLFIGAVIDSPGSSINLYQSTDTGATWSPYQAAAVVVDSVNDDWVFMRAVWQAGRMAVFHGYSVAGTPSDKLGVTFFGGWSSCVGMVADEYRHDPRYRLGWGGRTGTTNSDGGMFEGAFRTPDNLGWTSSGGAGTPTVHATGQFRIATVANELSYSVTPTNMLGSVLLLARVLAVAGGALTSQAIAIVARVANGVYDYEIAIQLVTTGYRIYNVNGAATLADVTLDMTTARDLMIWLDSTGAAKVAHRTPGATTWTTDYDASGVTNDGATPNANGVIRFGNIAAASATSGWLMLHWCVGSGDERPRLVLPLDYTNGWGKPLNARPESIPDLAVSGTLCRIAVTSGPGRAADIATIAPYYEHGIHHAHTEVSPSPSAKWRSTSTAEQIIAYDLGDTGWVGHGVGLFVAGANFRTAYLENYDGAAWQTRATLDLATGFTGLTPALSGDLVYPNTSTTAAGARWLWEQELKNGWVKGTAGSSAGSRILAQSNGTWSTAGTVIPILQVEDGTDLAGMTGCALVWPAGLVVWYPTTASQSHARYWRVRIPAGTAGQDTPTGESYYEAGAILLGRVQPFGAAWSWGKSTEVEPNVVRRTSASGVTRARKRGSQVKRWTAGWADEQALMHVRASQAGARYVGPTAGFGAAAAEDVAYLLEGLLEATEGGARPVVAIEALPAATGVVLDPQRLLYGHLVSSIRTTRPAGDVLGADEVLRTDAITIEGVP